ncbi:MAG: proline--tRNA ligase [Deltaproteobacteria bacterium RIFCSPLOWO2_12_FULL_40_28]|nr:MAG: proline--tRNA ligase [Deltaproteobacteria bacterium RIFCSPHIGHO2_02_FULL_40_28]OGQ19213.1 MAG: proline--tRNA ligase [Deltaproteobacteria bacterium RIFCSPHIGHO2_12_FULL_40_32]OGQ40563.1 MAG: proline--tRNA ligase [Deltaproteobacteria bacterium RIFCSPLOWO2_02_FULL_40_36]OGQ53798.1 MAG: proline--tRNA ligase [Deltaproteobacteria bacterium RIFCSPLOWO2_12_FULL_40_28]
MKVSELLIPTLRDDPTEAEVISHKLMIRAGFIRKLASGIYTLLPLGFLVLEKIKTIIRQEMKAAGAQEILMPMVLPADLWKETGRWDVYGKELLRLKDRSDHDYCLGPTHEEIVTDLFRKEVRSYRQLPLALYQIQTKFRDEIRPRFGMMRAREFLMKDCYSFDRDEESALKNYWIYHAAYHKIFSRLGLKFRAVEATTGAIGGTLSHEFQVLAESGEDEIVSCKVCPYTANTEKAEARESEKCPRCHKGEMQKFRGIEVGQVFYLGTKYSESLKAVYLDKQGAEHLAVMGCYGIGVGRTAAAAIEQNHDSKGIIWPQSIAPYTVALLSLGEDALVMQASEKIYRLLSEAGIEVLWDERVERAGVKFNDMDLIGIPIQVMVGQKGLQNNQIEIKKRRDGVKHVFPLDEVLKRVNEFLS